MPGGPPTSPGGVARRPSGPAVGTRAAAACLGRRARRRGIARGAGFRPGRPGADVPSALGTGTSVRRAALCPPLRCAGTRPCQSPERATAGPECGGGAGPANAVAAPCTAGSGPAPGTSAGRIDAAPGRQAQRRPPGSRGSRTGPGSPARPAAGSPPGYGPAAPPGPPAAAGRWRPGSGRPAASRRRPRRTRRRRCPPSVARRIPRAAAAPRARGPRLRAARPAPGRPPSASMKCAASSAASSWSRRKSCRANWARDVRARAAARPGAATPRRRSTGASAPDLRRVIQPKPTPVDLARARTPPARRRSARAYSAGSPRWSPPSRSHSSAYCVDVLHLALHDPRVAAARHPGARAGRASPRPRRAASWRAAGTSRRREVVGGPAGRGCGTGRRRAMPPSR